jgi:protein phosphatase
MSTELQLNISVGALTEQGKRGENQDNMTGFTSPYGSVYIVADGMGGHRGGAEASRTVVESYRRWLSSPGNGSQLADALQSATAATNADIFRRGQSGDPAVAGMGSTVVLAVVRTSPEGSELTVGHVGDSRAYLLRRGSLRRLTRDHSAVQRLVDEQIITAEQAQSHPEASVLTRAMGQQAEVALEVSPPEPLQHDDIVLLCSDGLSGYVPDDRIQRELAAPRAATETAKALVQLALRSGSDDNITVQVLRAYDPSRGGRFVGLKSTSGKKDGDSQATNGAWKSVVSHVAVGLLGLLLGIVISHYYWIPAPVPPKKEDKNAHSLQQKSTAEPQRTNEDKKPPQNDEEVVITREPKKPKEHDRNAPKPDKGRSGAATGEGAPPADEGGAKKDPIQSEPND